MKSSLSLLLSLSILLCISCEDSYSIDAILDYLQDSRLYEIIAEIKKYLEMMLLLIFVRL